MNLMKKKFMNRKWNASHNHTKTLPSKSFNLKMRVRVIQAD